MRCVLIWNSKYESDSALLSHLSDWNRFELSLVLVPAPGAAVLSNSELWKSDAEPEKHAEPPRAATKGIQ